MQEASGTPVEGADGATVQDGAGICCGLTMGIIPNVFTHRLFFLPGLEQAVPEMRTNHSSISPTTIANKSKAEAKYCEALHFEDIYQA